MPKIRGYGEIRLSLDDNYNDLWYDIEDFDIELLGWDEGDGGYPIFKLTRKKDEDDHAEN